MSQMTWTTAQQAAIDARRQNLLLSAAAGRSLDHDRKTDLFCHGKSIFCCVYRLFASRNNRNSGLHHGISGF